MTDRIVTESLNKIRALENQEILNENAAVAAPAAKVAGKGLARFIPGVGLAAGAYDAYNRAKQGDWAGAGLSALGGAAALVPGIGTAASLGIAGAQAMRDKQRTGSYLPGDDEIAAAVAKDNAAKPAAPATPAGANPSVLALQQKLIAKGAKIQADGKMGPQTQAAMKQFPDVKMAEDNEENKMSESQKIAELMSRLAQLEQAQPQVADEGIADLAKGAWQGAKTIGKNLAGGWGGQAARTAKGTYAPAASAAGVANKVGKTAAANKGKLGVVGGATAGAAAMSAALQGGGAATKPEEPAKPSGSAATKPAAPAAPAATGPSPADLQELGALAQELEQFMGQDPELDNALLSWEKVKASMPQPE